MNNTFKALLIIVLLSISGMAIWLYEMKVILPWHSLTWLWHPLYSPYVISLLPALAFLTPFFLTPSLSLQKIIFSVASLYAVNMICYFFGEDISRDSYVWFVGPVFLYFLYLFGFKGFLIFLLLGFIYWMVVKKIIGRNIRKKHLFLITFLSAVVLPLSLITVYFFEGYGCCTGWVDAVKMGYPIFWITFLLGICGIIIERNTFSINFSAFSKTPTGAENFS